MLRPVEAPADAGTITQVLTALCSLRSEDFAAPESATGRRSAWTGRSMQIDWESEGSHRLKIGDPVPRSSNFFAATDGQPMVFTLSAQTVRLLDGEYHDHHVMSFPVARARRIVLRLPAAPSPCAIGRRRRGGRSNGCRSAGSDVEGIDLSRIGSLVATMSQLQTTRFIQYDGEIPSQTGLSHPRLTVEVTLGEKDPVRVLRIGDNADEGDVCAARAPGRPGRPSSSRAPPGTT